MPGTVSSTPPDTACLPWSFHAARRRERRFFTCQALAAVAVVLVGFGPSYFFRPAGQPELGMTLRLHGMVFSAWLVLFLVQSVVMASGRSRWHARLGLVGFFLAPLVVATGMAVVLEALRRNGGPPGVPVHVFVAVPFADMLVFALLVAMALFGNRDRAAHKRLLLVATLTLTGAAFGRIAKNGWIPTYLPEPVMALAMVDVLVLIAFFWDWRNQGRVHRVWQWLLPLLVLSQVGRLAVARTAAWQQLVENVKAALC